MKPQHTPGPWAAATEQRSGLTAYMQQFCAIWGLPEDAVLSALNGDEKELERLVMLAVHRASNDGKRAMRAEIQEKYRTFVQAME